MSRPRLRRRTSVVSFTSCSSSGGPPSADVTVKISPPWPRRTMATRTCRSEPGSTITSPTSTSPAWITSSTEEGDTGQDARLHPDAEWDMSRMPTAANAAVSLRRRFAECARGDRAQRGLDLAERLLFDEAELGVRLGGQEGQEQVGDERCVELGAGLREQQGQVLAPG